MEENSRNFETYQFWVRFPVDILATMISWFLAYYLRFYVLIGAQRNLFGMFLGLSLIALGLSEIFLFINRLYEANAYTNWTSIVIAILKTVIESFLCIVLLYYFVFQPKVSRLALALFTTFQFIFLVIGRNLTNRIISKKINSGYFKQNILLVGHGSRLLDYYKAASSTNEHNRFNITGQYLSENDPIENITQISAKSLKEAATAAKAHMVVISFPSESVEFEKTVLDGIELLNSKVFILPKIPRSYVGATITDFNMIPTIQLNCATISLWRRVVKRAFDFVSCLCAVIILSPLFLIISILIKLTSKGPVLFKQKRVTQDGKIFTMYKFRSMRTDMPEQNGPHWTEENDPRITKLGKILRKTSLDELPQFFNVIEGSMSLIGPRPERPELVEEFKKTVKGYDIRHKMKAGITGWAQANSLRQNSGIEERVAYDLYYIENWSISLDVKIIFLTLLRGFVNKNAY